ncbi:ABC-type antimicrobial peptide transport system, ATPase component [Lactococcus lactis subsp. lactis]|uniref:ABC-type antimicrobial peptide transport system, ATPase component n=1 Tax=Lactococcus lactis subsp. lactis TaxID=1360 RepID=A0A0B8QIY0_LACLL|nr:ABC-type antimicrobial peptide transport system, ATPase component [Lactococcus lactis subsp. lactis]
MAVLELKNIRKSYFLGKEEFPVLKGINLEFERGDFVSLLGESGGGKSTLMNIIGGLDRKYEGDVIVDGLAQKTKKKKIWMLTVEILSVSSSNLSILLAI